MNLIARIASFPLRLKLYGALFAAGLAALALSVFAVTQYNQAAQPIADTLMQALAAERVEVLNAVTREIANAVTRIATVQQRAFERVAATDTDEARLQLEKSILEATFRDSLNANPHFRQVRFVSFEGQVLVSVPPALQEDDTNMSYFRALNGQRSLNGVYVGEMNAMPEPTIEFVTVPAADGQPLGYLVVSIDPSGSADPSIPNFYSALRTYSFANGQIAFYLVTPGGRLEATTPAPEMPGEMTASFVRSLVALAARPPGEIYNPLVNRPVRVYVTPVSGIGRLLVAESRLILLLRGSETGAFAVQTGLLLIAILGGLLLIGIFFEVTIIRPMQRLSLTAARAAQGRVLDTVEIPPQRDEIGMLTQSFRTLNAMMRKDIRLLEARIAQRTRDIETTREIGQIASSLRDVDTLLRRILDMIVERFENVYHAQVFLIDATKRFAVLRASTGEAGRQLIERGHRLAVGSQSVVGKAAGDGLAVVATDTLTSPIHKANDLLPHTRAELALPLRTGEGVIGVLDVQSRQPEAFAEGDIRLFQAMADHLAIALTNARLFEESQARLREIEDLNRRLTSDAWRGYANIRRRLLRTDTGGQPDALTSDWSDLQRRAVATKDLVEIVDKDTATFALPVILRDQVFGAVEWTVPRSSYNENTRLLARELVTRLAITADNVRLFEQSQRMADRERLVNEISNRLIQQSDVAQVLQIAVRELGQALRVPETTIRLALGDDSSAAQAIATPAPRVNETA